MKDLIITEKPSVAVEFAKVLGVNGPRKDGYIEGNDYIITWCIGHLVTMSYPDKYDTALKQWTLASLPFLPEPDNYRYEVIPETSKQFQTVKKLLNNKEIRCIFYSGDSAREGEYIQRLVRSLAGHRKGVEERRVWIDSQTEDEIRRGIKEARPLSEYDSLSDSAYARAIEDYGIGINLSRAVTLMYGNLIAHATGQEKATVAIGRVMSCVLGMVVRREREIRADIKVSYYTVSAVVIGKEGIIAHWKPGENSFYYKKDDLYEMKGFLNCQDADNFINKLNRGLLLETVKLTKIRKAAPLLYNLAELQGECTKKFRLSPDQTLTIVQSLYEKKLTTYPRTDARVLTTALCAVIKANIAGLAVIPEFSGYVSVILASGSWNKLSSTKYVNDAAVSDHYAIIPTGKSSGYTSLNELEMQVYSLICRRFLSIFYPPAEFAKIEAAFVTNGEIFQCSGEHLLSPGWMEIAGKIPDTGDAGKKIDKIGQMKKGNIYPAEYHVKEETTQAPKRYTTGSMVLAMENAGKLIADEELREQIKGTGIGTSATRAETIKKLITNRYIQADKNQVLSPTLTGETIYEIIELCAPQMLSPEITANWEKGLKQVTDRIITKKEYLTKMYIYISKTVERIKSTSYKDEFERRLIANVYPYYNHIGHSASNSVSGRKSSLSETLTCPICGKPLMHQSGTYFCSGKKEGCKFIIWEKWCRKQIPEGAMKALLSGKKTQELKGFKAKNGNTFSARLKLINGKIVPVWE